MGHIKKDGEELIAAMATPQESHHMDLSEAIDVVTFIATLETVVRLAVAQIETPIGHVQHHRTWAKPKKKLKRMVRALETGDQMHQNWSLLVEGIIYHITLAHEYLEEAPNPALTGPRPTARHNPNCSAEWTAACPLIWSAHFPPQDDVTTGTPEKEEPATPGSQELTLEGNAAAAVERDQHDEQEEEEEAVQSHAPNHGSKPFEGSTPFLGGLGSVSAAQFEGLHSLMRDSQEDTRGQVAALRSQVETQSNQIEALLEAMPFEPQPQPQPESRPNPNPNP